MDIEQRESILHKAVAKLCRDDTDLAAVVADFGPPPLFHRRPGFRTLLLIILEQQVSLASARAAYQKLLEQLGGEASLTPAAVLKLDASQLKASGFSRQKTRYAHELARSISTGDLDLKRLAMLSDADARESLTAVTGIGQWTANVYLLMAMGRTDIWPVGDIALAAAIQAVKSLQERPTGEAMEQWGETWRPHRSAAAHILWHWYLSSRSRHNG